MKELFISPSPHIHSGDSIERTMSIVLLALVPACLVSLVNYGLGALIVLATAMFSCVFVEWFIVKFLLRTELTITDGSALLTGLLLGMNLPSNLPIWIIFLGSIVAIGIAKMSFGGLGANIFNPALVGRVFLLIAYPAQMTTFPKLGQMTTYIDAETSATPLGMMSAIIHKTEGASWTDMPSTLDLLFGFRGGALGEISALALLLGLVYMLYKKVITWHIPISILLSTGLLGGIMWRITPSLYPSPLFHLLTGGVLLGAVFMATDYVTSPLSKSGQLLYGSMIGILTILIRLFGSYPEGMSFAILIMNAFTPLINKYMRPKHFGGR